MPVLDLDGLTRYDGKIKDYIGRFANWQKSQKAGAVAIYPVPETTLEPTVDFLFTETPPASGDKSPANPSTISGVNRINLVRANSNLLPYPYWLSSGFTANGITYIINEDGSVSATGTAESSSYFPFLNSNSPSTEGLYLTTDTYKYFGCPEGGSWNNWGITCIYGSTNTPEIMNYDYGSGGVIKLSKPGKVSFAIRIAQGVTVSNLTFYPRVQIIEAPFEKNEQDAYNIDLGGTYYGGTLDVATGVMTVTMQYMVADSNAEIIWIGTNFVAWRFPAGLNCIGRAVGTEVCSHFPFSGAWDGSFAHFYATPSSGLYLANPNWTASTYRQYFTDQYNNGTPVTACYQLADPITVQLTPTEILSLTQPSVYDPRVNTVYTDASAVQVGYVKSPIRSEYELTQAIIATEGGE